MGGQSTQIAFAAIPSSDILEDFSTLNLWEENYRLYTHSYLTFGNKGFEYQMAELSVSLAQIDNSPIVYNPCLNDGYNKTYNLSNGEVLEIGDSVSSPDSCREYVLDLLQLPSPPLPFSFSPSLSLTPFDHTV